MNHPTPHLGTLANRVKDRLILQAIERRSKSIDREAESGATASNPLNSIPEKWTRFDQHPGYQRYKLIKDGAQKIGVVSPFFQELDSVSSSTIEMQGKTLINFSGYNYLGLSGHPEINRAASAAIEKYGTSVSASRIVSGERAIHRELEAKLAEIYGVDDSLVMVSGHATTVTTLGYLFCPRDLILHDALIHNCAVEGAKLSGAKRLSFPHNDWVALDQILSRSRSEYERVCIVIEGLYSMDGDFPDAPKFIEIKKKYGAFLMIDEAHSFGVLGQSGLGIKDHFGINPRDVDIWMGTLSKSLASCGGYIAGEQALIDNLKFAAPGFVYSVGMAPPLAAAALASISLLISEPDRVQKLQSRGIYFLEQAQKNGINTGLSCGFSIIPAITGSSLRAARLSHAMKNHGINVQPILYPAVSEKVARLRFFMSCDHTDEQIEKAVFALALEWRRI
jgi:8-amino-7-oxononanoate synthase